MANHESNGIRFHTVVGGWSASGRALTPAHLVVDGEGFTFCGKTATGKQGVPDDGKVRHCQTCLLIARNRGLLFVAKAVRT